MSLPIRQQNFMNKLNTSLQSINITPNAFEVYKYLLIHGSGTVKEIAKDLNIARTTVHQNIEKLVTLGILYQVQKGSSRILYAAEPEIFSDILDNFIQQKSNESEKLSSIETNVNSLINELNFDDNRTIGDRVNIKYLEDKAAISSLYDEILKSDEIKSYVNTSDVLYHFPENEEKFYSAAKKGASLWDLQILSEQALKFRELCSDVSTYHVKFFPVGMNFHAMDYLIYEDSIAIVQGESVPHAVVIKDKHLADNARSLYDLLWGFLPNE